MRLRMLVALTLVGALAMVAAVAAMADVNPNDVAWSYSTFSKTVVSAQQQSFGSSKSSKIQLAYIFPNGVPKARQTGCVVASNDNKRGHIKIGTPYTNSGVLRSTGRWTKFADTVKAGDKFCHTGVGPTGWQKVKCGNWVWLFFKPQGPILPKTRVELVRNFSFTYNVTVRVQVAATGAAFASCDAGGAHATAYAYASGYGLVDLHLMVTARSRQQAMVSGSGVNVSDSDQETIKGMAREDAIIRLNVSAQVSCTGAKPQAPPAPPPGAPTPPSPKPPCAPNTNGPNCVPGKNGTTGPGAGTGGSGAGGNPGSGSGPTCRDASGDLVPGTPDANGNCAGAGNNGTTGGSGPGGPPPPPPSMCIDPVTGATIPGTPDQLGYCT